MARVTYSRGRAYNVCARPGTETQALAELREKEEA